MPAEPCRMPAEARAHDALRALEIIILIVTFILLVLYASVETAGTRPDIRCAVVVAEGAS